MREDFYTEYRPLMMSIAYRMVGSVSEAEDIVQDAFLRVGRAGERTEIAFPKAYLSKITTRLCIDHLRSARVRREQYVGPWLPEPIIEDPLPDAEGAVQMGDSLSMAFLVLLESLTPVERAVFVLREVFGFDYSDIAEVVNKSEVNCRQLATRARRHVEDGKPRFEDDPARRTELVNGFLAACSTGDTEGLTALLASDVAVYSDGGGKVVAAKRPIHGLAEVTKFLVGLARLGNLNDMRPVDISGQSGCLIFHDGDLDSAVVIDTSGGTITAIWIVRNPDKLKHLEGDLPG